MYFRKNYNQWKFKPSSGFNVKPIIVHWFQRVKVSFFYFSEIELYMEQNTMYTIQCTHTYNYVLTGFVGICLFICI